MRVQCRTHRLRLPLEKGSTESLWNGYTLVSLWIEKDFAAVGLLSLLLQGSIIKGRRLQVLIGVNTMLGCSFRGASKEVLLLSSLSRGTQLFCLRGSVLSFKRVLRRLRRLSLLREHSLKYTFVERRCDKLKVSLLRNMMIWGMKPLLSWDLFRVGSPSLKLRLSPMLHVVNRKLMKRLQG
jgi:hypothetical protein